MVMSGEVSVRPYTWVTVQPSSCSTRSMVWAAGAAPAAKSRTPRGAARRSSSGAFRMLISTVGAAQNIVTRSVLSRG